MQKTHKRTNPLESINIEARYPKRYRKPNHLVTTKNYFGPRIQGKSKPSSSVVNSTAGYCHKKFGAINSSLLKQKRHRSLVAMRTVIESPTPC